MSWASSTCFTLRTLALDLAASAANLAVIMAVFMVAGFVIFIALSIQVFLIFSWLEIKSRLDLISLSKVFFFSYQTFLDSSSSFLF